MDVVIEPVGRDRQEQVLIRCHAVTEEVREISAFIKSRQGTLTGTLEGTQFEIPVSEIFYIESVDGRTFLYTGDQVFQTSARIYELEELLRPRRFCRISKSTLVNLMKIKAIQPDFNGRFTALLRSGEKVLISRSYVKAFKAVLKGEAHEL